MCWEAGGILLLGGVCTFQRHLRAEVDVKRLLTLRTGDSSSLPNLAVSEDNRHLILRRVIHSPEVVQDVPYVSNPDCGPVAVSVRLIEVAVWEFLEIEWVGDSVRHPPANRNIPYPLLTSDLR